MEHDRSLAPKSARTPFWTSVARALGARSAGLSPADAESTRAADPDSLRTTTEGTVIGFAATPGAHAWFGIPFAEPPLGELRWKAPLPPKPRAHRLEATREGNACSQVASSLGVPGPKGSIVGSEDCLYLNVWAPRLSPGDLAAGEARLPVMVWIHGGGNSIGTGSSFVGSRLASAHGVIVVTVNYRLGPLGWFRHPALRAADTTPADDSGNFGTLDLIRALEWVKGNAAAFGGDPERVTIFGESAGGVNVYTLLASRLAKGLFQRAIVQSGMPSDETVAVAENRKDAETPGSATSGREISLRLLVKRGRAADRAAAVALEDSLSADELARFLRSVSPAELIQAYESPANSPFLQLPLVFRDGDVLPQQDLAEYLASPAGIPSVPVMLGTNRDEIRAFQLGAGVGIKKFLGLFPRAEDPDRYLRSAYFGSAIWKAMGADEVAAHWVRSGWSNVWVYRFDWDEEPRSFVGDLALLLGAGHGMEVPFVFGHFEYGDVSHLIFTEKNAAGREALSAAMMSYWTEFAASGDPGRGMSSGLPHWEPWSEASADAPRFMILDTEKDGGLRMSQTPVTRDRIVEELAQDAIFVSTDERCQLLRLAAGTNGVTFRPEHFERVSCSNSKPLARGGS